MAISVLGGSALAEPVQIVAFGDSLIQGYGLNTEEGFVPQLQNWLLGQGAEVTVINAGVSGDTTSGGLSRIDWALTPEVKGMILALGGNDVLRGTDPRVTYANMQGILDVAKAQNIEVLLVGLQAPGNYGPDYATAFDAIWPKLTTEFDVDYVPGLFEALPTEDPAELRKFIQADGLHPNSQGVKLIIADIGPTVLALIERIR